MIDGDELLGIAEDALRTTLALGADAAEVFVSQGHKVALSCHGPFASPTESDGGGMSIRAVLDGRLGVSGTSGLRSADRLAEQALSSARNAPKATFAGFAPPQAPTRPPSQVHPELLDPDPARLEACATNAIKGLYSTPETSFASFSIEASTTRFAVANSEGTAGWDETGRESFIAEARVGAVDSGTTALDFAGAPHPLSDDLDIGEFGAAMTQRAASSRGAEPLNAKVDQVIMAPGPAVQALGLITPSLSGAFVASGQSRWSDKFGEKVVSERLTLRDPGSDQGRSLLRIDHEGVPFEPLTLVKNGRVESFLWDHASAHRSGKRSNGRGLRGSGWAGTVGVRPLRVEATPGNQDIDALIASADRAVFLPDPLAGGFTSNQTTGDFSLVAPYGFLVENGQITRPLPHTTVAGNAHTMFQELHGLGDDPRSFQGFVCPSLVAGGVTCAS